MKEKGADSPRPENGTSEVGGYDGVDCIRFRSGEERGLRDSSRRDEDVEFFLARINIQVQESKERIKGPNIPLTCSAFTFSHVSCCDTSPMIHS